MKLFLGILSLLGWLLMLPADARLLATELPLSACGGFEAAWGDSIAYLHGTVWISVAHHGIWRASLRDQTCRQVSTKDAMLPSAVLALDGALAVSDDGSVDLIKRQGGAMLHLATVPHVVAASSHGNVIRLYTSDGAVFDLNINTIRKGNPDIRRTLQLDSEAVLSGVYCGNASYLYDYDKNEVLRNDGDETRTVALGSFSDGKGAKSFFRSARIGCYSNRLLLLEPRGLNVIRLNGNFDVFLGLGQVGADGQYGDGQILDFSPGDAGLVVLTRDRVKTLALGFGSRQSSF